jgi:hypothetical protein
MALAPAAANALVLSFNPTSLNFGSHGYGTSTSLTTTFTVTCDSPPGPDCAPQGDYDPRHLTLSPDSYHQTNNCDEPMEPAFMSPASCTITVTFSPRANGTLNGVLRDVGGGGSMTVSGVGFGVPSSVSGGSTTGAGKTTSKKCKKKKKKKKNKSASAAKKKSCKKKKKKKK